MDWARYRSPDDPVPDGTSSEEGGPFPIRSRDFLADPQSPRDLTRYVRDHDPFGQDQPHYTDDAFIAAYASSAIDRIYAAYGEQRGNPGQIPQSRPLTSSANSGDGRDNIRTMGPVRRRTTAIAGRYR